MHKFRTILSVVATAAMVLGTMGAATASAASVTNETRADFIAQLDQSLGIQPVFPTSPDFSDVPTTNADYGYIEAAFQKGFINGISAGFFGPSLPITRAEAAKILVEAYEGGNYTPTQTATTYTDNASIPTALVGYVAEANSLNLMVGFTSGAFGPEAYLTTAQEVHLVAQLKAAIAAAGFKVSASSTDVAVGQIVTLSSTSVGTTTFTATGANSSSALVSGSSFVASAAGNYTVTGTDAAGNTATVTIGVYGSAAALKVSAPATVVANGVGSTTVTVSVVDANGNVVANDSGSAVTLSGPTNAVTFGSQSATVATVNGVATYTLTNGVIPGAADTLTATDTTDLGAGYTSPSVTVTATAQTPTSLSVTAPSYISANQSSTSTNADVQVLDQTGNPMLYGTFGFSVAISGPATFAAGSTTAQSLGYTGNGNAANPAEAQVTIYDEQGTTGAITLTASATNLKSGTATVTAVIAGSPAAIQLTAPSTTSFSEDNGATGIEYQYQAVDSHNYPVAFATKPTATVQTSGGSATNFTVVNNYDATTGAGTVTITDTSGKADAGSYTIQLSDSSNTLTSSATDTFTETAGAAKDVSVSAPSFVGAANPSATVSAQLIDAYGNNVTTAGIPVDFSATGANSASETLSATQVDSNANGVASITVSGPAYVGYIYGATAQAVINGTPSTGASATFKVANTVAATVGVSLKDTVEGANYSYDYVGSSGIASSSDTVQLTFSANDQYGTPITTGDTLNVTFSGNGSVGGTVQAATYGTVTVNSDGSWTVTLDPSTGTAVVTAQAVAAGNMAVTATDASVASGPSGSANMDIVAGKAVHYALFDTSGNDVSTTQADLGSGLTVSANTPVELFLEPVDAAGNSTFVGAQTTVDLSSALAGGNFRLSATGSNVTSVTLPAGTGSYPVYYVNGTAGTYFLNNGSGGFVQ